MSLFFPIRMSSGGAAFGGAAPAPRFPMPGAGAGGEQERLPRI